MFVTIGLALKAEGQWLAGMPASLPMRLYDAGGRRKNDTKPEPAPHRDTIFPKRLYTLFLMATATRG
jgi:hypothetical protein